MVFIWKKSKWSSSRKYSKWYSSGKKGKWSLARNIVNGIHLEKKGKFYYISRQRQFTFFSI
jgi:hypothetical protein